MKKLFRFAARFSIFIIAVILLIALAAAVFGAVGPDKLVNVRKFLDAGWWMASLVRWLLLAAIIAYLPRFARRQAEKHANLEEAYLERYDEAEGQNATYETLRELEQYTLNHDKLRVSWEKLANHPRIAGGVLIGFELLFVQLPHLS